MWLRSGNEQNMFLFDPYVSKPHRILNIRYCSYFPDFPFSRGKEKFSTYPNSKRKNSKWNESGD
jgi:hypothetical protein